MLRRLRPSPAEDAAAPLSRQGLLPGLSEGQVPSPPTTVRSRQRALGRAQAAEEPGEAGPPKWPLP